MDWQSLAPVVRGLGSRPSNADSIGAFSHAQSGAVLIAGVTCASISLLVCSITLRWFLMMRRSFRHHLILFLIGSSTFRSIWYFVFPIVVFARGNVDSKSGFCQASGFFLSFSLEISDFAILVIALHTILHIFKPTRKIGKGGLYPYRRCVYAVWVALPALSASLAFTNPDTAYVFSGTFCYLPKRPLWYRLALAWIPRYLIFITIFLMYATIYAYVHLKFEHFNRFASQSYGSSSEHKSRHASNIDPSIEAKGRYTPASMINLALNRRPQSARTKYQHSIFESHEKRKSRAPWDDMKFLTSSHLQGLGPNGMPGIAASDFAQDPGSSIEIRAPTRNLSLQSNQDEINPDLVEQDNRKPSEVLTTTTNFTGDTVTTETWYSAPTENTVRTTDPLKLTRIAIRRQLRFLFLYPAVYLAMWTFPFASHCLTYSDYYAMHPPFWLSLIATCMLALQAGVECVVFSLKEKPWRKADKKSRLSISSLATASKRVVLGQKEKEDDCASIDPAAAICFGDWDTSKRDSNWWEAEGRKRKDSVWLGTDAIDQIVSQHINSEQAASNP